MELPFAPPTSAEGYFIVPSGIRPTLQKTRIEVCPFYHQYISISIFNCFSVCPFKYLVLFWSGPLLGCTRHEAFPTTSSDISFS